jgi:hypothetical protein
MCIGLADLPIASVAPTPTGPCSACTRVGPDGRPLRPPLPQRPEREIHPRLTFPRFDLAEKRGGARSASPIRQGIAACQLNWESPGPGWTSAGARVPAHCRELIIGGRPGAWPSSLGRARERAPCLMPRGQADSGPDSDLAKAPSLSWGPWPPPGGPAHARESASWPARRPGPGPARRGRAARAQHHARKRRASSRAGGQPSSGAHGGTFQVARWPSQAAR